MHQPKPSEVAKAALARIHAEADAASAKSLRAFLDRVVADIVPEPKQYGLIEEAWQRERYARVIPAAEYIAGFNPHYNDKLFFYEGWTKGSDKSSAVARICCWLLGYSKRTLHGVAAARDKEQAEVVFRAMKRTADLNKAWLGKRLEFKRSSVVSKVNGSTFDVLASVAGGVAGITPDVIICDEVSQWDNQLFWDGLFAAAMKRSGIDPVTKKPKGASLVYLITNAGLKGSWQWNIRESARLDQNLWSFFDGEVGRIYPSWLTPEVIQSVRNSMGVWEAKRLLDNEWLDPSETGERFFSIDDIESCVGEPKEPKAGYPVYFGIDYGEKKDRTVLVTIWQDSDGVVHISDMVVWQGTPTEPVQLEQIEQWLRVQWARYPNAVAVFDPFQTLSLIQKLEKEGQEVRRFEFRSGKGNLLMGEVMRTQLKNRKLCYGRHTGLYGPTTFVQELREVIGQEKSYGLRMQHTRSSHDDRVCAVASALVTLLKEMPTPVAQQETKPPTLEEQWEKLRQPKHQWDRNWAARRGLFGMQS